jgi:hypothetical protein
MLKKMLLIVLPVLTACSSSDNNKKSQDTAAFINEDAVKSVIEILRSEKPGIDIMFAERGVKHTASLWRAEDGTETDYKEFVINHYIGDPEKRRVIFRKISDYFESIYGFNNEITIHLKKNLDEATGEIDEIDRMFGNYAADAHLLEDLYSNKIAFAIALNFPYYALAEKENYGPSWNREEWAMARLGDIFVSRVPAELNQALAMASGNADMYIADYNIHMGNLRSDDGKKIFPDNMILLSHWNLRDEIKANYSDKVDGRKTGNDL